MKTKTIEKIAQTQGGSTMLAIVIFAILAIVSFSISAQEDSYTVSPYWKCKTAKTDLRVAKKNVSVSYANVELLKGHKKSACKEYREQVFVSALFTAFACPRPRYYILY